jgi:hypothetical protein
MPEITDIMNQLFLECEHGDTEHRQWLKDKIEGFTDRLEKHFDIEIYNRFPTKRDNWEDFKNSKEGE